MYIWATLKELSRCIYKLYIYIHTIITKEYKAMNMRGRGNVSGVGGGKE